tara:strand:+ start:1514 stop:1819 length:306 start_codon:yes stop_codon:yes gene_type:complete
MKRIILLLLPILCLAKNLTLEHRINPLNKELMDMEIFGHIKIIPGNLDGYDFYYISVPTEPVIITNFEIPMNNRSLLGLWVSASAGHYLCLYRFYYETNII